MEKLSIEDTQGTAFEEAYEKWLWDNEEAQASVKRGLAQAARGETSVLDLSELPDDEDAFPY